MSADLLRGAALIEWAKESPFDGTHALDKSLIAALREQIEALETELVTQRDIPNFVTVGTYRAAVTRFEEAQATITRAVTVFAHEHPGGVTPEFCILCRALAILEGEKESA